MQVNLYYEYASIIISFIILLYFGTTKRSSSFHNRVFFVLIIDNMLTSGFDIANKIVAFKGGDIFTLRATTYGYFFTHLVILPLIFFYVLTSIKNWYEISIGAKAVFITPILLAFAALASNPFTQFIYHYDESGDYFKGPGYIMLYILVATYILLMIALLVIYRKYFSLVKKLTVISLFPLLIVAMGIQAMYPNQRIETFGITYGLLLMFFMIQNPQDQIDSETGLYNKAAFVEMMSLNISAKKYFNLVEIIVTDFEEVSVGNESEEDNLLACRIADFLKEIEGNNIVYRVENNLFCMAIEDAAEEDIIKIIRSISKRFTLPWNVNGYDVLYKVKMCHMSIPEEIDDIAKLMGVISGSISNDINKELLSVSDFDLGKLERQSGLNAAIARGLDENNIELVFSPVCAVKDKKIVSADTSIRLFDSEIGYISKEEILDFVDKHGKIGQLSKIQIESVCGFIKDNKPEEIGLDRIAVELTSAMCHQVGFIDYIISEVKKNNINPSSICFKISEYTIHMAPDLVSSIMKELKEVGFKFVLDDYGSGFTNIASIYELSFDCIEVSETVVKEAMENDKARITLESTFDLAKALGIRTVVRGIEAEKDFDIIEKAGCERAIGSYFLENISAKELVSILISQENLLSAETVKGTFADPFKEGGIA